MNYEHETIDVDALKKVLPETLNDDEFISLFYLLLAIYGVDKDRAFKVLSGAAVNAGTFYMDFKDYIDREVTIQ